MVLLFSFAVSCHSQLSSVLQKLVTFCNFLILTEDDLSLFHTIPTFSNPENKAFENIVEKGENAGNQHFVLFPQYSLSFQKQITNFMLSSANAFNLDKSEILSFGKELHK